jgi:hypothetical protein
MNTVFVIEELLSISATVRHIAAIRSTEVLANKWIADHDGDQLIMLDDGSIVPKYEITVYEVI